MYSNALQEDMRELSAWLDELGLGASTLMVTGSTGLVGSLIVKACLQYNRDHDRKISVVALARSPEKVKAIFAEEPAEAMANVCFVYQDITQPISRDIGCDYIVHTANSTTSKFFLEKPVEVLDSIYAGTAQILSYARDVGARGVVYLSSMEVFGRVDSDRRIGEQELGYLDIQNVRSCYSEGKRTAELMCKCYAAQYGVPVRVARLAQTFGAGVLPGENRVFAQFARSAVRGENIVMHTRGQSVGNYCYTADAIRAILLLLVKGEAGEAYTVVNEQTTMTIADMAKMVAAEFSGGKSQVVFDIPEGNKFGYAPDTKMRLSAKKLNELGWSANYELKEMYRRMLPDLK